MIVSVFPLYCFLFMKFSQQTSLVLDISETLKNLRLDVYNMPFPFAFQFLVSLGPLFILEILLVILGVVYRDWVWSLLNFVGVSQGLDQTRKSYPSMTLRTIKVCGKIEESTNKMLAFLRAVGHF